jgi:hypothetical protein
MRSHIKTAQQRLSSALVIFCFLLSLSLSFGHFLFFYVRGNAKGKEREEKDDASLV